MVVDAFHDRYGAKAHCLADGEAGEHEREGRANCVEEKGFGESVVKGAIGIGNVDFVVVGVHITCQRRRVNACNESRSLEVGPEQEGAKDGGKGAYDISTCSHAWRGARNTASCR